jgi:hypothetical protein
MAPNCNIWNARRYPGGSGAIRWCLEMLAYFRWRVFPEARICII